MRRVRIVWEVCILGVAVLCAACGDDGQQGGPGVGGSGSLPAPICNPGATGWQAGTQAFQDSTAAWGLDAIAAQGIRLNAVDFDGDGWADLVARRGGSAPNDFAAGGTRTVWLLRNTQDGAFEDVTFASGVLQNRTDPSVTLGRPAEVFAWGDVDNDGDLDVVTGRTSAPANPTEETTELLLNNGDGTFSLGPAGNPFRKSIDAVASVTFVDFDRDGNLDLWIVGNSLSNLPVQDRLYQGDGAGNFVDVTSARGLATISWSIATVDDLNNARGHSIGWAGNACDLNNDGSPELLAASYGRAPNQLWRATGSGAELTFVNRSIDSGYAFDQNQDWSDNESARCWCTLHPTEPGCAGLSPPQYIACTVDADAFRWDNADGQEAFRLGGNSAATMCADVNNDGWLDLVTSEIVHWDVGQSSDRAELLVNSQDPNVRFDRPGNVATGLERSYADIAWNEGIMSGSVFDFDSDGWADVYFGNSDYPGTHGLLYRQDAAGHFVAVPIEQGIDHHRSNGSAVADFDHDGDLDLAVGHSTARCNQDPNDDSECYATQQIRLFENLVGAQGNFLSVRLKGALGTNRAAIGARVSVTAGAVTQTKDVGGGHGHYGSQDDLALLFGLGNSCEADVSVRWPDASLTTETVHLPAGHRFVLEQGLPPVVDSGG